MREPPPRRRLRQWLLVANLVLWSVVAIVFLLITQPMSLLMPKEHLQLNVSPNRLKTHVQMLSETFAPRDYSNFKNLDRTAEYIKREFAQAQGRVTEQPYTVNGGSYRNVIASFGPPSNERIWR